MPEAESRKRQIGQYENYRYDFHGMSQIILFATGTGIWVSPGGS
jgi:hypothetical protein